MLTSSPPTTPNEGLPGPDCFVAVEGVALECDRGTAGCFVDHDPLSPEEVVAIESELEAMGPDPWEDVRRGVRFDCELEQR